VEAILAAFFDAPHRCGPLDIVMRKTLCIDLSQQAHQAFRRTASACAIQVFVASWPAGFE